MATYSEDDMKRVVDQKPHWKLYQAGELNYRGKTVEGQFYGEVLAKLILDGEILDKISESARSLPRRGGDYKQSSHTGYLSNGKPNALNEKRMAIALFNLGVLQLGEDKLALRDYQTPLKAKQNDDSRGEIDLLARDDDGNLCLIELKPPESKETVLRAAMEIYTYGQLVEHDLSKFKEEFECTGYKVRKIVLVGQSTVADLHDLGFQKKLFSKMEVEIYAYTATSLDRELSLPIKPTWNTSFIAKEV